MTVKELIERLQQLDKCHNIADETLFIEFHTDTQQGMKWFPIEGVSSRLSSDVVITVHLEDSVLDIMTPRSSSSPLESRPASTVRSNS